MSAKNGTALIETDEKPVIDRSRVTHKQVKANALIGPKLIRLAQAGDDIGAEALIVENDTFIASQVVSVPSGWLPPGWTIEMDGWLDEISQVHYEELARLVNPQAGEAKRA